MRTIQMALLAGILVLGPGSLSLAADGLVIAGWSVSGTTVTVSVANPTGQALHGSVYGTYTSGGNSVTASVAVSVDAGSSVTVHLNFGGVGGSLDPSRLILGITDSPVPF
jgi:hypothetical protein